MKLFITAVLVTALSGTASADEYMAKYRHSREQCILINTPHMGEDGQPDETVYFECGKYGKIPGWTAATSTYVVGAPYNCNVQGFEHFHMWAPDCVLLGKPAQRRTTKSPTP